MSVQSGPCFLVGKTCTAPFTEKSPKDSLCCSCSDWISVIGIYRAVSFFNFITIIIYFTILYWFCHTSTCIHHGCTRVPHPEPPSLPIPSLWVIPVHQPQASCILHRTWTGDSFLIWYYTCFDAILPNHPLFPLPESKRLFYTSVSLLLSRIQGCHYHLSKFHIYALVYCIGVFLSGLFHAV